MANNDFIYGTSDLKDKFHILREALVELFNKRNATDAVKNVKINDSNLSQFVKDSFVTGQDNIIYFKHGDKTINLLDYVNPSLIKKVKKSDFIESLDNYIEIVNNLNAIDNLSENHGCRHICTGICMGSCKDGCNGIYTSK